MPLLTKSLPNQGGIWWFFTFLHFKLKNRKIKIKIKIKIKSKSFCPSKKCSNKSVCMLRWVDQLPNLCGSVDILSCIQAKLFKQHRFGIFRTLLHWFDFFFAFFVIFFVSIIRKDCLDGITIACKLIHQSSSLFEHRLSRFHYVIVLLAGLIRFCLNKTKI